MFTLSCWGRATRVGSVLVLMTACGSPERRFAEATGGAAGTGPGGAGAGGVLEGTGGQPTAPMNPSARCHGGDRRCGADGVTPERCEAGSWVAESSACPVTCESGACVAACTEGAEQCAGSDSLRVCRGGEWIQQEVCEYACVADRCSECAADATRCADGQREQCSATSGSWAAAACPASQPVCEGDGSCVCPSPSVACSDACTDLETDPRHCGECERSCGGGACEQGVCRAEQLVSAEQISGVAAGGGKLFYHDGTTVYRVDGPQAAVPIFEAGASNTIESIATDGDFVYWTRVAGTAKALYRNTAAGDSQTLLAQDSFLPVVAGDHLYFRSQANLIRRMNGKTNSDLGNIVQIAFGLTFNDTAAAFKTDGTTLAYMVQDLGISAAAADGSGTPTEVAPSGIYYALAAHGDRVYYLTGQGVTSVSAGSEPTTVGSFTYSGGRLVVDSSNVYVAPISYGAQGVCTSRGLQQLSHGSSTPVERWTMSSVCTSHLVQDNASLYFVASPVVSRGSAAPIATPVLFRLTK